MALGEGRTPEGSYDTSATLEAKSLKYLNLSNLEEVVAEMEYIDKEITRTKDDIYDAKEQLDRDWDGKAAKAFILQFNRLNDDLKDFEGGFKDIKTMLQEASNMFLEQDQNLYRTMDENYKKQSNAKSDAGSSKKGPRKDTQGPLENSVDAVLEKANMTEKGEIYSTIDEADPADLTSERKQPKAELYSTIPEERPAVLESYRRSLRGELNSTVGEMEAAEITGSGRGERGESTSTLDSAEQAALIQSIIHGNRGELYSTVVSEVTAVLSSVSHSYKEEIISTIPSEYTPLFASLMHDAKAELFSTMETEYFPVFETRRRAYKAEPGMLLFMALYAYLAEAGKKGLKAEGSANAAGQDISALQGNTPSNRATKMFVGATLQQAVDAQLMTPVLRTRMADAVNMVFSDMPAILSDGQYRGEKSDEGKASSEMVQAVLADYQRGSDRYRSVQSAILTDKTTTVLVDAAFSGKSFKETAFDLGKTVIDQVAPANLEWSHEQKAEASERIGNRICEYTWNRASYDAARASGMTAETVLQAVAAENENVPMTSIS